MTNMDSKIKFHVGDVLHEVHANDISPETTLNMYLRDKMHMKGTKRMCLEGGCGCCVVAIETKDPNTQEKKVIAVNSCLMSIYSCHGLKIHTIEGIGGPQTKYHPLQEGLANGNGSQCGYCSPGMVMNMYALTESGQVTADQVEDSFSGNLCRCTGYRPILESFRKFASQDIEDIKPCKKFDCHKTCPTPCEDVKSLLIETANSKWVKFNLLTDLLDALGTVTDLYMLVAGNTMKGVYKNEPTPQTYFDVTAIKELTSWSYANNIVTLGGNTTLADTITAFKDIAQQNNNFKYLSQMAFHIGLVANVPVRNIGTIAGNLMIKHTHNEFPSDIFLLLETVAATIVIVDSDKNETRVTAKDFLGVDMKKKVIKNIILKEYDSQYLFYSYKIMPRAQSVHAAVNAGFLFKQSNGNIDTCTIVYGNINKDFVHAKNTENYFKGKNLFDNNVLKAAYQTLSNELVPSEEKPGFTPEYRKNLAIALLYKFVLSVAPDEKVSAQNKSARTLLTRKLATGSQEFSTNKLKYPLSEPKIKLEALAQTSGRAEYVDDKPDLPELLHCQFVEARAPPKTVILSIDTSEALKYPGVVAFYGKDDIPGKNTFTPFLRTFVYLKPEPLFCNGIVAYYSQPVGVIVATTEEAALKASELVKVKYSPDLIKPYLNIKDCLDAPLPIRLERVIHVIDIIPKRTGFDIKKEIEGEFNVGLQYHFHMEVQTCTVIPEEDGYLVYPASQWMDAIQIGIATVLGIQQNRVRVEVRRLGGGFGGKILRSGLIAAGTALAAHKLNKPVKMRMSLEKNMRIIGKRYPCYIKYKVKVNAKGVIQKMNADIYSDYGGGANEIIEQTILGGFPNGYDSDTWLFSTYFVRTDMPANAYCRAPGTLETISAIESIMEHIARELDLDPLDVKLANLNKTKYPQLMKWTDELIAWASVRDKQKEIEAFNKANRWKKRGICVIPMRWQLDIFGGFPVLVSIFHSDGTVAVSHGGIEMGQGINTKVAQVCAYKLGIALEKVHVIPSNSMAGANAFMSGNSVTSEAVCTATIYACETLLERLKPIKDKLIAPTWEILIQEAFVANIHLTAGGFQGPKLIIDTYDIFAASSVNVEVDILTGQYQILDVDIIEDVGDCINPLIDVGQLEGAFLMGVGYHTTENIEYDDKGMIITDRTWNYWPPGAKDIPQNFRIKFPANNPSNIGVLHTKAIAEPPTCLSVGVPLSIRHAVGSARLDADPKNKMWYPINGCSTIENTFLNSANNFNQYTL